MGVYNVDWYRIIVSSNIGMAELLLYRERVRKRSFVSSLTCCLLLQTCSGVRHLAARRKVFFPSAHACFPPLYMLCSATLAHTTNLS
jgi:hypothetical protein